MSEPLSKTELVRAAWITELRREGHRQCFGTYWDGLSRVCALGLLAEVAGVDPNDETRATDAAGISVRQANKIVVLNDGDHVAGVRKHSFSQIADVVEGWFK